MRSRIAGLLEADREAMVGYAAIIVVLTMMFVSSVYAAHDLVGVFGVVFIGALLVLAIRQVWRLTSGRGAFGDWD